MVSSPVVALFNSHPDSIELLESAFSAAGFTVVFASIPELRAGRLQLDDFVRRYDPAVVVYDIAPPYGENWQLLSRVRAMNAMRERPFVVTSVNARRVGLLAAREDRIYEVAGDPYDLSQIVYAAQEAISARPLRQMAGDLALRRIEGERRRRLERRHASWTPGQFLRTLGDAQTATIDRRRASRREAEGGGTDPHASAA